ncbi:unnamed protein product, partial [Cyprideis torosa]
MLHKALDSIINIGNAQVGDKTMLDTLVPAVSAFTEAKNKGKTFFEALKAMKVAAEKGKDSTIDLVAKIWDLLKRSSSMKSIALGCDPNARELKEVIKVQLTEMGYEFADYGSDDAIYANVAIKVAKDVVS